MTNVIKNGVVMGCRDENQLAAFLNNGWKIVEEKKATHKETGEPKKSGRPKKEQ